MWACSLFLLTDIFVQKKKQTNKCQHKAFCFFFSSNSKIVFFQAQKTKKNIFWNYFFTIWAFHFGQLLPRSTRKVRFKISSKRVEKKLFLPVFFFSSKSLNCSLLCCFKACTQVSKKQKWKSDSESKKKSLWTQENELKS